MRLFITEATQTEEETVLQYLSGLIKNTKYNNKVFLAGGAVRDEIMGKKAKDLDFLVLGGLDAGINFAKYLANHFGIYKFNSNPVTYPKFGTAKLSLTNNNKNLPNIELEFVASRKEKYKSGSNKPTIVAGTLEDDARRRDFTINSLLKNVSTGEIIDITGRGVEDIKNKVLRATSNPDVIFKEDPLRMMRLIRFFVKYDMKIDRDTLRAVKRNASQIKTLPSERIRDEFDKILVLDVKKGIKLLKATDLLKYILPELAANIGVKQNIHHKDDAFNHILDVTSKIDPTVKHRLMAIFHDIGKPITKTIDDKGIIRFFNHEKVGEKMVRDIMKRMKYPNELIDQVAKGVAFHMRAKIAGNEASPENYSDKALRKFMEEAGEDIEDILTLIHADNISHSEASSMPDQVANLRKRIQALKNADVNTSYKLPIDGNDLRTIFKLKPSAEFRDILGLVKDAVYDNPNLTKEEALKIVSDYLASKA
jgi:poly(A) polymerase